MAKAKLLGFSGLAFPTIYFAAACFFACTDAHAADEEKKETAALAEIKATLDSGDASAAMKLVDIFLQNSPNNGRGLTQKGWVLRKLNREVDADKAFDEAIAADPDYSNAYVGKGAIARARDDLKGARLWYQKALQIEPGDSYILSSICALDLADKMYPQAVKLCDEAYQKTPNDPTIAANLAVAHHFVGDFKRRDTMYKKARELGYSGIKNLKDHFYGEAEE